MSACTYAASLLVAMSLASAATAQTSAPIGIGNFGRVNPGYYRGEQPEPAEYPGLAALGIRTIINLTSADGDSNEGPLVEQAGMAYVHIPMTTHVSPTPAQIAQFLAVVGGEADQPVYVHCVGGRHRTGVMTAVYRMTHDKWTADQAFAEMKRYRFGASFLHREFKEFVYAFTQFPTQGTAGVPFGTANSERGW